jgi:hypothetical protein
VRAWKGFCVVSRQSGDLDLSRAAAAPGYREHPDLAKDAMW